MLSKYSLNNSVLNVFKIAFCSFAVCRKGEKGKNEVYITIRYPEYADRSLLIPWHHYLYVMSQFRPGFRVLNGILYFDCSHYNAIYKLRRYINPFPHSDDFRCLCNRRLLKTL